MKKMEMSAEEIVRSYREALDKKHQIEVLADLNICRKEDIVEVLKENGVKPQELPRKSKKKAVAMVAADVRAYEAEGKKALVKEALETLCGRLQKEYDNLRAEWENISAEYLSKINAIQVMMEEDLK